MPLRVLLPLVLIAAGFAAVSAFFVPRADVPSPQDVDSLLRIPALHTEQSSTPPSVVATSSAQVSVPILVYHTVRPSYPTDSTSVRAENVTPLVFAQEMNYLISAGYHDINFSDLESHLTGGTPLPAHPVILTFDDAWGDQYEYAFPVLAQSHLHATFFVFTNAIGRPGFLSWDELRNLIAAGMTIGSHSKSHPYLTKIADPNKLWDEIDGSKKLLEERLGIPINEFAYPFGLHDATTTALVKASGYLSARGDYFSGTKQTLPRLYTLSALNAPTTTALFERWFPPH